MNRGNVKLQNLERFTDGHTISTEKLQKALNVVLEKLKKKTSLYIDTYPDNEKCALRYTPGPNDSWVTGMFTGCYILAYQASGDTIFLDAAKHQLKSYEQRIIDDVVLNNHDVGFVYSPSCVAYYKLTGDEYAKNLGLKAANILYDRMYTEKGGFVLRGGGAKVSMDEKVEWGCRTMMDTMMNIPLLFWAGEITGDAKFTKAALSQCEITDKYLIRTDGSSYHHYKFELGTFKPLCGVTHQGNRNESTWSRGQSWGISGYPIAYYYNSQDYMYPLHRDVTYYFLNNLPDDLIPYWDFDFISGDEPRDTSAAAIAACGMLEAARIMPCSDEEKKIYKTAASKMVESIIDNYTTATGEEYDGLLFGVTPARTLWSYANDTCAVYGDYFYLEALLRLLQPDWKGYW